MLKRICIAVIAACSALSTHAEEETAWRDAKVSMAQLLNDGWSIQSSSSFHTDWRPERATQLTGTSRQVTSVAYPKSFEVDFILSKNGKWIWCAIIDPTPESKTKSRCMHMN
jgi:hypothetical protein